MPALQVKDFPEDLYNELKLCAAKEDRSISQQTVHILRDYLSVYRGLSENSDWMVVPKGGAWASSVMSVEDMSSKNDLHYFESATELERRTRIEKRKKLFGQIDQGPSFDLPEGYSDVADVVRDMREERDEQILRALGGLR